MTSTGAERLFALGRAHDIHVLKHKGVILHLDSPNAATHGRRDAPARAALRRPSAERPLAVALARVSPLPTTNPVSTGSTSGAFPDTSLHFPSHAIHYVLQDNNQTSDSDSVSAPSWDSSQLQARAWLDDVAAWLPALTRATL
eukprot:6202029-Pleurochrysis_carterae.AAC.2